MFEGRYVDLSGRGGPLGQDQRCKKCNSVSISCLFMCCIFLEAVPLGSFDLILILLTIEAVSFLGLRIKIVTSD
jgi:hypothetical protein